MTEPDALDTAESVQADAVMYTCPRCGGYYSEPGTCADGHPRENLATIKPTPTRRTHVRSEDR